MSSDMDNFIDKFWGVVVALIIGGIIILTIGQVTWSFVEPFIASEQRKCEINLEKDNKEYSNYCDSEGRVVNKDEIAKRKSEKIEQERLASLTPKQRCEEKHTSFADEDGGYTTYDCYENGNYCSTYISPRDPLGSGTMTCWSPEDDECLIKGNVSFSSGEKIYHMPDQKYYGITSINRDYGERLFCSEQEAINAGWRKSYE